MTDVGMHGIERTLEPGQQESWPEGRVKDLLQDHGLPVPRHVVAKPKQSIRECVRSCTMLNPPYVVKLHDAEVLHKSDVGGVRLNITDPAALTETLVEFRDKFPGSEFLVEEQAPEGVEFIVGLLRDSDFGLTLMAGFGGVLTELYEDVAFRVLPIMRSDCHDMLSQLKAAPLLEGFRGKTADREALIDLLLGVNELAMDMYDQLEGMDLNPVLVHERGVTIVDAKLILRSRHLPS